MKLNEKDVAKIRRCGRNPDTAFGPKTCYGQLKRRSYRQIVDSFFQKINVWYFGVAENLYRKDAEMEGANFTVMIINCIIIDLLSQYFEGSPTSSRTAFINFVNDHVLDSRTKKRAINIQSCTYKKDRWKDENITSVAEALYHGFRCGLVHSARILEYGRINYKYKKTMVRIVRWESDKKKVDINVNPGMMLKQLKKVFTEYKEILLSGTNAKLKDNFLRKYELEYGIKVKVP